MQLVARADPVRPPASHHLQALLRGRTAQPVPAPAPSPVAVHPLYLMRPNVEYHVPGKGIIRVLGLADLGLKCDKCYQVRTATNFSLAWRLDKSCLSCVLYC